MSAVYFALVNLRRWRDEARRVLPPRRSKVLVLAASSCRAWTERSADMGRGHWAEFPAEWIGPKLLIKTHIAGTWPRSENLSVPGHVSGFGLLGKICVAGAGVGLRKPEIVMPVCAPGASRFSPMGGPSRTAGGHAEFGPGLFAFQVAEHSGWVSLALVEGDKMVECGRMEWVIYNT